MFGRIADLLGRKHVYWLVAAVMAVAAIGSALAPTYWVLIGSDGFGNPPGYSLSIPESTRAGRVFGRVWVCGRVWASDACDLSRVRPELQMRSVAI